MPDDIVLGLLKLTGAETVVDYGAGTGTFALPVADALPRGRVVAVDLSRELLDRLRDKVASHLTERIEIVHTTTNDIPLPDGSADAVLAVNVLHEIADEPEALAEIRRVLKPGGRFVVVDWAAIERPVGPSADHVLSLDQARALVGSMGLPIAEAREPGGPLPYHFTITAEAPR